MKLIKIGLILFLLFNSVPALAYLDPGMGSMWIQGIIAVIAGAGVTIKMYWYRLKAFFFKNKNVEIPSENIKNDDNSL